MPLVLASDLATYMALSAYWISDCASRAMGRIQCKADAGADAEGPALHHERLRQAREMVCATRPHLPALQLVEDRDELVAPDPGHGVRGAHAIAQAPADGLEHFVPGAVAEGVVDRLEAVKIDQQHRHHEVVALGVFDGLGDAVFHQRAVGQARQVVVIGQVAQCFFASWRRMLASASSRVRRATGPRVQVSLCCKASTIDCTASESACARSFSLRMLLIRSASADESRSISSAEPICNAYEVRSLVGSQPKLRAPVRRRRPAAGPMR